VSADDFARARSLAVPPAWTNVWISADPWSHLQATGRDAKGRKQYRYHQAFTTSQSENKFADLATFGRVLGGLRSRVDRDLRRNSLDHDRVVATIVRLLDITSLRVGNTEYSRTNGSFGLTTLHNGHATVRGSTIHFTFRGKSSHDFDIRVDNQRLAKIVRGCQHLPGQRLFEYKSEDGQTRTVGSIDVNRYLSDHAATGMTAKTFRTWNATVLAAELLAEVAGHEAPPTKRVLNEVIDEVADHLGNTRAVCRNSYIHPVVIDSYMDGRLERSWQRAPAAKPTRLTVVERKTLRLLRTASPAPAMAEG